MPKILVVEDEPLVARNVAQSLVRCEYDVSIAVSARQAAETLIAHRFDLLVVDITLGDGDGIEVLHAFSSSLAKVPVVIISGQDSVLNRTRVSDLPMAVFLVKPFALSRLRELVAALLEEATLVSQAGELRNPSVVMYSHDTIGLGHMRRNLAIANALVRQVPRLSVLLLVGCPAGLMFETMPGIDYVKLPSMTKLGRNRYKPGSLRLGFDTTQAIRGGIIERVLSTISPDVFLVDHEPLGVDGELEPVLRMLRNEHNTTTVLGLRDILDEPELLKSHWAKSGITESIDKLYDQVLIYGNQRFYDSVARYELASQNLRKAVYCGIVTSARTRRASKISALPEHIVVSGGGGRDAFFLYEAALSAYAKLGLSARPMLSLIVGPLMDSELRVIIEQRANELGVIFYETVSDFPALLSKADLLVSMAGYNSTNEALATGCPMVVVPRVGPSSEQRIRAARLQELQLARVIYREALSPERLLHLFTTEVPAFSVKLLSMLDFNGAQHAAELISTLLDPQGLAATPAKTRGSACVGSC